MMQLHHQLAALVGKDVKPIRTTDPEDGHLRRISVIDVAVAITGHSVDYAGQTVRIICNDHPDIRDKITAFRFAGRGQRKTPSTDINGIVEFIFLLPGRQATRNAEKIML